MKKFFISDVFLFLTITFAFFVNISHSQSLREQAESQQRAEQERLRQYRQAEQEEKNKEDAIKRDGYVVGCGHNGWGNLYYIFHEGVVFSATALDAVGKSFDVAALNKGIFSTKRRGNVVNWNRDGYINDPNMEFDFDTMTLYQKRTGPTNDSYIETTKCKFVQRGKGKA
jgi:hypothetical protein